MSGIDTPDEPDLPEPTSDPPADHSDLASDSLLDAERTASDTGDQPPPRNGGDGDGAPPEEDPDEGLRAETGDPATYPEESVRDAAREPVGADHPAVQIAGLHEQVGEFHDLTVEINESTTEIGGAGEAEETIAFVEHPPDPPVG